MLRMSRRLALRRSLPLLVKAPAEPHASFDVKHKRTSFDYNPSGKGGEVGARNEAAFIDYKEFEPKSLTLKYGMPHIINLFTITPVVFEIHWMIAVCWAVFVWHVYSKGHYNVVIVERPEAA